MADFFQTGVITTLHLLSEGKSEEIELELNHFARKIKTTLIIPVLYSDYVQPAMANILRILSEVKYVNQIFLSLGKASREEFLLVREKARRHPIPTTVIWLDNPDLQKMLADIEKDGLTIGEDGKGKSCWVSLGLMLAQGKTDVVALHDSDILTYSREMLCRFLYPLVNPHLPYEFSKGYYARFSDRMHGRVTRLFITPLIKALTTIFGHHPLLDYLGSFRYPLSGEFAMKSDLTRVIRFPGDWGLEVSVLYEIYRNVALKRVCQVEIAHRYDHKHQKLSKADSKKGLHKMAIDIAVNIFKNMAAEGIVLSEGLLKTVQKNYLKISEDIIANYHADAMINGLKFDRHFEESAVETFYKALIYSSQSYLRDPLGYFTMPNWNRITAAYSHFLDDLLKIVNQDNR